MKPILVALSLFALLSFAAPVAASAQSLGPDIAPHKVSHHRVHHASHRHHTTHRHHTHHA